MDERGKRSTLNLLRAHYGAGKSLWFCGEHWQRREEFRPASPAQFAKANLMAQQLMNGTHYLKATCRMCGLENDGQATKCECGARDLELSTVAKKRLAPPAEPKPEPIPEPGANG